MIKLVTDLSAYYLSKIYEKLIYNQLCDYFVDKFGALLTDVSKVFDCIDHKLLIARLFWYRVSLTALNFIHSDLTNRTQGMKTDNSFSRWSSIE